MKKIIAFLILIIVSFNLKAQYATYKDIAFLKTQTINVVLDDAQGSTYNEAVKSAFPAYWKFCNYKFISASEYKSISNDKTKIFLLQWQYITGAGSAQIISIQSGAKELNTGKRYNTFYLGWTDEASKLLPNILQLWQKENETTLAHNELEGKSSSDVKEVLDKQRNLSSLKTKTLYIDGRIFWKVYEDKISKVYPYKFKIVNQTEILEIAKNQDENNCYLYFGARSISGGHEANIYEAKDGTKIYAPEKVGNYKDYFEDLVSRIGN